MGSSERFAEAFVFVVMLLNAAVLVAAIVYAVVKTITWPPKPKPTCPHCHKPLEDER